MRRTFLMSAICGALALGGLDTRADAQSPVHVTMLFDGGYAFILGKAGDLTVGAFKTPSESHDSLPHRMMLRLTRGTFAGGRPPDSTNPRQWNLDGFDIEPASYGAANGPLTIPRVTGLDTSCPTPPKRFVLNEAANTLSFLPDVTAMGNGTVDATPSRYTSRVRLAHGRLVLTRAGGCWEYRDGTGRVVGSEQALAAGLRSIKYNIQVPGDTFELKLSRVGGTDQVDTIRVKPEWVPENQAWEVAFSIGRFSPKVTMLAFNRPMEHFDRYYTLLQQPPPKAQRVLPYKKHHMIMTAPGDECAAGLFVQH